MSIYQGAKSWPSEKPTPNLCVEGLVVKKWIELRVQNEHVCCDCYFTPVPLLDYPHESSNFRVGIILTCYIIRELEIKKFQYQKITKKRKIIL